MTFTRKWHGDLLAAGFLVLLWLLFFWRILTPVPEDQLSFKQGDFSVQFVAFAGYQYERFNRGEVPLWNPYNNGGMPFIADTQAAVFYPPRWVTLALSQWAGEWQYNALQLEAIAHVLLLSLLTYLYVRILTIRSPLSHFGALTAAVVISYGGFISGYPPLQLALLEAAVWLPLAATGILLATQEHLRWRWLLLAGAALGLSWLAGHPQTSWFVSLSVLAYFAWRCINIRFKWWHFVLGILLLASVTFGATAITFLPGIEYLMLTTRQDMGFDAKSNGFPIQDVVQFILPGSVSLFSPLYVGLPALVLALLALRRRAPDSLFWAGLGLLALLYSLGANGPVYPIAYHILPGAQFFRGQERAALLVSTSLAILAGSGAAYLSQLTSVQAHWLRWTTVIFVVLTGGLFGLILVAWFGFPAEYGRIISIAASSALVSGALLAVLWRPAGRFVPVVLFLLIIFELFSTNMNAVSNYDPIPAHEQLSISPPPLVQDIINDESEPFRVDGFRGLQGNYGSLYGVMDIRGISPLFLDSAHNIIYRNYINNPLAWELFAVKYVFSEREELRVATEVIGQGSDREGNIYLHRLNDPRPFALLLYRVDPVDSDVFAQALLDDPAFDPRESVIILGEPTLQLPDNIPTENIAEVITFEAELVRVSIDTPESGVLSLAMVDYPGWEAQLNGEPVTIRRAYGALMAAEIPAGQHILELRYNPLSYRIGAFISLVTWAGLALTLIISSRHMLTRRNKASNLS